MTNQDMFGCDVTLADKNAVASWDKTLHGFLAHAAWTGNTLAETLEAEPNFALGNACKGLFSLLLGRKELTKVATDAYNTAVASDRENSVTQRERHFIQALGAWLEGKPTKAIAEMGAVLAKYPHDALAMKVDQAIRFMLGDGAGMRRSLEDIMDTYNSTHKAQGYFNGCYAFTLEETGEYGLAEKHGRLALEQAPDDAWGLHAVQHVFDMTARAKEGLEWVEGRNAAWENCNNFRYHVHWHNALMHLDLGDYEKVLDLYDTEIRKDHTDDYRDISNGTSMLLRLEFEGVNIGNRWEEMAEICETRAEDNLVAFADLHYMMALCNSPDDAAATRLITNMQSAGEQRHHDELAAVIKQPGVLAATGLEAFRDHNFELAYNCLSKARPEMQSVGGSHAQRDIFERLAIESALRGGLHTQARGLLRERDLHRGHRDGYSQRRWAALETGSTDNGSGTSGNIADLQVA